MGSRKGRGQRLGKQLQDRRTIAKQGRRYQRSRCSALQAASARGSANIVELLLKNGADVGAKGGPHGTALKAAKKFGHMEVVKLLQGKGATRFHLG